MKFKQQLINLVSSKKNLQKRSLHFKQSFDEVNKLINSIKKKNNKKG